MLKKVHERKKKALIIQPFVSVVSEKAAYLQRIFGGLKWKIVGYYANSGRMYAFDEVDIAVCTIEKVCIFQSK